ncbi:MAG: DUF2914 domain-containing protein [Deltaproteobacteria bacterium]|nr:DUF2914 domain-containing protein [Deltaproteobacteria bacterium]
MRRKLLPVSPAPNVIRRRIALAVAVSLPLGLSLVPTQGSAQQPGVWIADAKFGRAVVAREVKNSFTRSPEVVAPVSLWMRLEGSEGALDRLRREGRLPIFHKWYFQTGTDLDFEGTTDPIDFIDLDVGRKDRVPELKLEDGERGYFDWRTWSVKQNTHPGSWLVEVVDAKDDPVPCAESLRDRQGDCTFQVRMGP